MKGAASSPQVPLSKLKDSFNDGTSVAYIEELEQRYRSDPTSVDKTWGMFFRALGAQHSPCTTIDHHNPDSPDCLLLHAAGESAAALTAVRVRGPSKSVTYC